MTRPSKASNTHADACLPPSGASPYAPTSFRRALQPRPTFVDTTTPAGARRRTPRPPSLAAARATLLIVALAPLYYVVWAPRVDTTQLPPDVRDLAALLWVASLLPTWIYLRTPARRRPPLPILPVIGIEYGMYYALAPALGLHNVYGMVAWLDPLTEYTTPIQLALLGWLLVCAGYVIAAWVPLPALRATDGIGRQFTSEDIRGIGFTFLALGGSFELVRWTNAIPLSLKGTVIFLAHIVYLGIAALYALRARGALSLLDRMVLYAVTLFVLILELGTGATYNVIIIVFAVFIGTWLGRPVVRARFIVAGFLCLAMFVTIRGVMTDFRRLTGVPGMNMSATERSKLMTELLEDKVRALGVLGAAGHGFALVAERSTNIDLLADVIRRTPSVVPYWNGETYLSLVGAVTPRFLWPEKPQKGLGQAFGHRYSYLEPDDLSTSVNLPNLVELHANFGGYGVILGSVLLGMIYRILGRYVNRPGQSIVASAAGLVLLHPLLIQENDFAMQFGGLLLYGVALYGLYRLVCWRWRPMEAPARARPGVRGSSLRGPDTPRAFPPLRPVGDDARGQWQHARDGTSHRGANG